MLIIVKFFDTVQFGKDLQNISISVEILEKFRFWSIFMKISILDKNYENLDFGQNCLKILILVNIFGKSQFKSISLVNSIWDIIFPK